MNARTKSKPEPVTEPDTDAETQNGDIGEQAGTLSVPALYMGALMIAATASELLSGEGNAKIDIPEPIIHAGLRNWIGLSSAFGIGDNEVAFKVHQGSFFAGFIAAQRATLGTLPELTNDPIAKALEGSQSAVTV